MCRYWQHDFDWRKQESHLNTFSHYRAEINDVGLHFIHEKGNAPDAIPLLLIHGWPDSFARFLKIIPLLTSPAKLGSTTWPSFDVVAPSLPGFGFSDKPRKQGLSFKFGDMLHTLMVDTLGYERFAVQGGDWGGAVAEYIARDHASSVIEIHLTDIPFFHMLQKPDDPSDAEKKYLQKWKSFSRRRGPTRSYNRRNRRLSPPS